MNELFFRVIEGAAFIIDIIGVTIILVGIIKAVIGLFGDNKSKAGLTLGKHIGLGLTFLMAAEALETILIDSIDGLLLLSGIFIIRSCIAYVNHWEMKNLEQH